MSDQITEATTTAQMELKELYTVRTTEVKNKPGEWSGLLVEVFINEPDSEPRKIGEYRRNYHTNFRAFSPFERNGKHYALFSHDYETCSVMSLPDCKTLADSEGFAFCPVEFYVPDLSEWLGLKKFFEGRIASGDDKKGPNPGYWAKELERWHIEEKLANRYALVSGCTWGDDSGGWNVSMLDLSGIEEGKLEHVGHLGYFQLPNTGATLAECVSWSEPTELEIAMGMRFRFSKDGESGAFSCHSVEDLPLRHYKGYDVELVEVNAARISREDILDFFDRAKPILTELADLDRSGRSRSPGKHESTARDLLSKMDKLCRVEERVDTPKQQ